MAVRPPFSLLFGCGVPGRVVVAAVVVLVVVLGEARRIDDEGQLSCG